MALFWLSVFPRLACSGLVGYWPFDGNEADLSGNGNDGVILGGTYDTSVPDALGVGQALSLNSLGANDRVAIAAHPSLNSPVFTLSMFFNDRGQESGVGRLTSRDDDSFETGIDVVFGTNSLSYFPGWVTTDVVPLRETWQHVAYVADGHAMTVYVDGLAVSGPVPFGTVPLGEMYIGNRVNGLGEGFRGLIDDVSLYNVVLPPTSIADLAAGLESPLTVDVPLPPEPADVILVSSAQDWMQSTASLSGGMEGDWEVSAITLPDVSTYTLEPTPATRSNVGRIHQASFALNDVNAISEGIVSEAGVRFYRTTFELGEFETVDGQLRFAADNGGIIYINGEAILQETTFAADNWATPLPAAYFNGNGALSDVIKFDSAIDRFNGWVTGENEIVVALRNPDDEDESAGGFAIRLDLEIDAQSRCDLNADDVCDILDINLLGAELLAGTSDLVFDQNRDGQVDLFDHARWLSDAAAENGFASAYLEGDANLDGTVNALDLNVVGISWQQDVGVWSRGDFDVNGRVGPGDLNKLGVNWLKSIPVGASAVPEGTSDSVLFLSVLAVVAKGARRRR